MTKQREMRKRNEEKYAIKFKFTPQTSEPNLDIKSKIESREKDISARM